MKTLTLIIATLGSMALNSSAIFTIGGDNPTNNTTAPPGDRGWSTQARFNLYFICTVVGPHHFITTRHEGGLVGDKVSFQGVEYTTIARYDDPATDIITDPNGPYVTVWKIEGEFPPQSWAKIAETRGTNAIGMDITAFGHGAPRGAPITKKVSGDVTNEIVVFPTAAVISNFVHSPTEDSFDVVGTTNRFVVWTSTNLNEWIIYPVIPEAGINRVVIPVTGSTCFYKVESVTTTQTIVTTVTNNVVIGFELNDWDDTKRWGLNHIEGVMGNFLYSELNANGGPNECGAKTMDSGGGIFIEEGGEWKIIAMVYSGDPTGPLSTDGGATYFEGNMMDFTGLTLGTVDQEGHFEGYFTWQPTPDGKPIPSRWFYHPIPEWARAIVGQ